MLKIQFQVLVGNRIKELRGIKNLSQEKLSHKANLDRTYINSVENGKRNVSINNIKKICDALDCSVKCFFDSNIFD